MIAVSDLRIGDWVFDGNHTKFPMQITSLSEGYVSLSFPSNEGMDWESTPDELQGIPVTIELLKKIGFKEEKALVLFYRYWDKDYKYKLDIDEGYTNSGRKWSVHIDNGDCCTIGTGEFTYLHELQNLVSAIAKEELEVKLW